MKSLAIVIGIFLAALLTIWAAFSEFEQTFVVIEPTVATSTPTLSPRYTYFVSFFSLTEKTIGTDIITVDNEIDTMAEFRQLHAFLVENVKDGNLTIVSVDEIKE